MEASNYFSAQKYEVFCTIAPYLSEKAGESDRLQAVAKNERGEEKPKYQHFETLLNNARISPNLKNGLARHNLDTRRELCEKQRPQNGEKSAQIARNLQHWSPARRVFEQKHASSAAEIGRFSPKRGRISKLLPTFLKLSPMFSDLLPTKINLLPTKFDFRGHTMGGSRDF